MGKNLEFGAVKKIVRNEYLTNRRGPFFTSSPLKLHTHRPKAPRAELRSTHIPAADHEQHRRLIM